MKRKFFYLSTATLVMLFLAGRVYAKDGKKITEKILKRTAQAVQGEVATRGTDFISVVYKRDLEKGIDYEILLHLDKDTKVEHKNNLKEIQEGDTVYIQYEEEAVELADRQETRLIAKLVSFVKPAKKKPAIVRTEPIPPQ